MVIAYKTCRLVEAVFYDGVNYEPLRFHYPSELPKRVLSTSSRIVLVGDARSGSYDRGIELLKTVLALRSRTSVQLFRATVAEIIATARGCLLEDVDVVEDVARAYCAGRGLTFERGSVAGSDDKRITCIAAHLAHNGHLTPTKLSEVV